MATEVAFLLVQSPPTAEDPGANPHALASGFAQEPGGTESRRQPDHLALPSALLSRYLNCKHRGPEGGVSPSGRNINGSQWSSGNIPTVFSIYYCIDRGDNAPMHCDSDKA